jgi:hypothetical protein
VSLSPGALFISFSVDAILVSATMFRNGDCPSSMTSACFSDPSKTASPVVFAKSAMTMPSLSVSAAERPLAANRRPTTATSNAIRLAAAQGAHDRTVLRARCGGAVVETLVRGSACNPFKSTRTSAARW